MYLADSACVAVPEQLRSCSPAGCLGACVLTPLDLKTLPARLLPVACRLPLAAAAAALLKTERCGRGCGGPPLCAASRRARGESRAGRDQASRLGRWDGGCGCRIRRIASLWCAKAIRNRRGLARARAAAPPPTCIPLNHSKPELPHSTKGQSSSCTPMQSDATYAMPTFHGSLCRAGGMEQAPRAQPPRGPGH